MPLYEYICEKCHFEFEELVFNKEGSLLIKCRRCGAVAERKMSSFSSVVQGSPNESVDVKIGRDANDRWQLYRDRQKRRHLDKKLETVELPKVDGKYRPVMSLGSQNTIKNRNEYSETLRKHKQDREKRGQSQFSETGSF